MTLEPFQRLPNGGVVSITLGSSPGEKILVFSPRATRGRWVAGHFTNDGYVRSEHDTRAAAERWCNER